MSAQSRATRKWPVGRIELEAMMSRSPFWTLVLNFVFLLFCAPTRGVARIAPTARSADRPLHLVLRFARRLQIYFHSSFAPLAAAFRMAEDTEAEIPTHCVASPSHNSFPPGFVHFFADFAAAL
jgi:hypothetical protein